MKFWVVLIQASVLGPSREAGDIVNITVKLGVAHFRVFPPR